jgi:hypothetical protein
MPWFAAEKGGALVAGPARRLARHGLLCSEAMRRRGAKKKEKTNRYEGILVYYVFWWEGKTVQKKSVDETFWQKP